MQNPPMFYREERPCAEVSHFVLSFWEFKIDEKISAPVMHEVFPDGCISLIFYCNKFLSVKEFFVSAINPKSIYVPMQKGSTMFGMRILPEAGSAFFGMNPLQIKTGGIEKELFDKRNLDELQARLYDCENFVEAVAIYENYAKKHGVRREEIDLRLAKATRIFIESEGLAKIAETAREIGLSERQFERNYKKASGMSPKQFARICRFRATTVYMIKNSEQNWAERAAEKGFTDQSHLNREFSNLTGNSPVKFSENVKRIKHGKILE